METMILLILTPFLAIWEGYVLSVMWRWFIVPVFQAPALTIPVAIGLTLIMGMLTHQLRKEEPETEKVLAMGIFGPAMFLLCGWIAKGFM